MSGIDPMYAAPNRPHRCVRKAALAGVIAGLVGTAVKTICEAAVPPRPAGQESPLGVGIRLISTHYTGHDLDEAVKHRVEQLVHWGFGVFTTVGYAIVAEYVPIVTIARGVGFGFAFWLVAHEIVVPAIGWSPWPPGLTLWEQGNEAVSHVLFGVSAELTRQLIRRRV